MEKTRLVFLPSPGYGHLIPAVELAKGLLDKQPSFSITVLLMHLHIPSRKDATGTASYIQSVAASHPRIHFIDLPLVDFPFENTHDVVTFVSLFIDKHKSYVKEAIKSTSSSSSPPATALIIDLFSTTMIDVGKELGIPTYLYFTSGADLLGLMLYLPTLDVKVPCEFKDLQGEVEVPGMLPLPPLVMPEPLMNKKSDMYNWFVCHGRRFRETNGLIVNTFEELEPTTLKSIGTYPTLTNHEILNKISMEKKAGEGTGDKIDMEEPRLVFLPTPAVGHLKSTVELAKCLIEKQPCFSITVLLMDLPFPFKESTIDSYVQSVAASNPRIHFVHLPPVDFPIQNNQGAEAIISLFIEKHESHVKEALKTTPSNSSSPPTRVSALIMDLFSTTIIHVGRELGIPTYIYFTAGAATLGLMLHLPTLHVKIPCEFKDFQGKVEVPGMLPLPHTAMPEPVMNKKKDGYEWFVYHGRRFREADGLIVNTFAELEPTVIKSVT